MKHHNLLVRWRTLFFAACLAMPGSLSMITTSFALSSANCCAYAEDYAEHFQPAVRGATLSASEDNAARPGLWLPIEGADFKSRRSSRTLTHAACTIVGREADRSSRSTRS
jgi:hypothetical protein